MTNVSLFNIVLLYVIRHCNLLIGVNVVNWRKSSDRLCFFMPIVKGICIVQKTFTTTHSYEKK